MNDQVNIIGSGPNGLAAAIYFQQRGISTRIYEQADVAGGATRTGEVTLPGFRHDLGSAIHPLAFDSPFFRQLPLQDHGLEWIFPEAAFAHPFGQGEAVACYRSLQATADQLGKDRAAYLQLMEPILEHWESLSSAILSPLSIPQNILSFVKFGLKAIQPATKLGGYSFSGIPARLLFYGAAAHSTLPLGNMATSSIGLVLLALAHQTGWPFPKGGADGISKSLISYYKSLGGELVTGFAVNSLADLPKAKVILFDLTPTQLLKIEGTDFSPWYRYRLQRYKYGAAVFKMDWALEEPIPFASSLARQAGTVHLGFTPEEIELSERKANRGKVPEHPYVLLAQNSVFDPSRVPQGKQAAWAYCHVPTGSTADATSYIEDQIERAAPGFRETILARKTWNSVQMEAWNPNLYRGEVNGGRQDITQLFTRPIASLKPYRTSNSKIYICSSSTPPGGGVHGMCGYNAAELAFKDHFSSSNVKPVAQL